MLSETLLDTVSVFEWIVALFIINLKKFFLNTKEVVICG